MSEAPEADLSGWTCEPFTGGGLTYDVYDHTKPRPPGLEDEELLLPGLPVPANHPDRWFREHRPGFVSRRS